MSEVLPGIHQFRLPMVGSRLRHINGYLLKGDDGYALVDCGWDKPDVLEALKSELRDIGVDLGDIRTLIISHFHADHYGLAGTLVRLGKLRLLMHRIDWLHVRTTLSDPESMLRASTAWLQRNGLPEKQWSDEDQQALESFRNFTIMPPHVELEDAAIVNVGRHQFRVIWTPGHTAGHICLYDAERRLILTGDHILDPITPSVGFSRPNLGNPLGDFLASLRKVAALDAELVLPAHGEPFKGLQRRIDELLAHHEHRESAALDALANGPVTAAAVAAELPWTRRELRYADLPALQQRMALSETIAHLEELRATGRVTAAERAGRIYYEALPTLAAAAAQ